MPKIPSNVREQIRHATNAHTLGKILAVPGAALGGYAGSRPAMEGDDERFKKGLVGAVEGAGAGYALGTLGYGRLARAASKARDAKNIRYTTAKREKENFRRAADSMGLRKQLGAAPVEPVPSRTINLNPNGSYTPKVAAGTPYSAGMHQNVMRALTEKFLSGALPLAGGALGAGGGVLYNSIRNKDQKDPKKYKNSMGANASLGSLIGGLGTAALSSKIIPHLASRLAPV